MNATTTLRFLFLLAMCCCFSAVAPNKQYDDEAQEAQCNALLKTVIQTEDGFKAYFDPELRAGQRIKEFNLLRERAKTIKKKKNRAFYTTLLDDDQIPGYLAVVYNALTNQRIAEIELYFDNHYDLLIDNWKFRWEDPAQIQKSAPGNVPVPQY